MSSKKDLQEYVFNGKSFMDSTMFWDKDAMLEFRILNKNSGNIHPVRYIADPGTIVSIKVTVANLLCSSN